MRPGSAASVRTHSTIPQAAPPLQVPAPTPTDSAPAQVPEDVMLDIAYAAFRLHGGDEAKSFWQLTQPLAARLQPAADTRRLLHRQNGLAAQPAGDQRRLGFHDDLNRIGSVPAPLRASALVALGRNLVHLPVSDQLSSFQRMLSTLALLPAADRAATLALWPLAAVVHNLGLPASQALHDYLKEPANWRGAEELIAVGIGHLLAGKCALLAQLVDHVAACGDPLPLTSVLLELFGDPAFSDTGYFLARLSTRLRNGDSEPAQSACLATAARMLAAGNQNLGPAFDAVRIGLSGVGRYKPVADVIQALLVQHGNATAGCRGSLLEALFFSLDSMDISAGLKPAWTQLIAAALDLPGRMFSASELPHLIARCLCRLWTDERFQPAFDAIVAAALNGPSRFEFQPLRTLLHAVASGLFNLKNDVERSAAFDCLLVAFASIDRAYRSMAFGRLMEACADFLPGKLDILFNRVLGKEAGFAYAEQVDILCSIKINPCYDGPELVVPAFLERWLAEMETLGGPQLGEMLTYLGWELERHPAIAAATPAFVTLLDAARSRAGVKQ